MVLNRLMVMAGVGAHALKTARSLDELLGPIESGHTHENVSPFGQKLMANKKMHLPSWGKGFSCEPNFMEDEQAAVQELISVLNASSDAQVRAAVMEIEEEEGRVVSLCGLPKYRNRRFFYTHPAQMRMIWNKFLDRLSALDRRELLNNTLREDEKRLGNDFVNMALLIDVLVQYELKQAFKPIMNLRLASKKMQLPLMDEETNLMQMVIQNSMAPLIEDFIAYSQYPEKRNDKYRVFTHQMIRSLFDTYLTQLQAMMDNLLTDEHLDPNLFVTAETYNQHIAQLLDSLLQPAVDSLMALPADDEHLKFKCNSLRPLMAKCSESTRMKVLTVPDSKRETGWKLASKKLVGTSKVWRVKKDDFRREQMKKYVGDAAKRREFLREIYTDAAQQSHFPSADDKKLERYVDDFLMPNQPL